MRYSTDRYPQHSLLLFIAIVLASFFLHTGAIAAKVKDYAKGDVPKSFKLFSDGKGRFAVSYPGDWDAPKPDDEGVQIFAPDNSSNMRIQVFDVGEDSLESIARATKDGLKKNIKAIKFLSDRPAAFGAHKARHRVFQGEVQGTLVKIGQLLFKKGNRMFVINYGSTPKRWDEHSAVSKKIIASLKPGK
ncbi:MAG: hypothetical protein C4576_19345 [Desulfobacteraceae bacterium]|nr:MAG: hypothetical protein C4576_19345 [Desulfobacteraceae bacterium]